MEENTMKVGEFYKCNNEGVGYSDAEILAVDGDWVVLKYHPRNGVPYAGQPFVQKIAYFLRQYTLQKPKKRFWLNLYVYDNQRDSVVYVYKTKEEADKNAIGEYFVSQSMVEFDEKTAECKPCKCNC